MNWSAGSSSKSVTSQSMVSPANDRTKKLEGDLARDKIQVTGNLGWKCRGQEAVSHQPALLIMNEMMFARVA